MDNGGLERNGDGGTCMGALEIKRVIGRLLTEKERNKSC